MYIKRKGFTLAEVLITLMILGIIAAIIVPNLIKNYQKKILVTELKRWYSDMSNTVQEYKVLYNTNKITYLQNGVSSIYTDPKVCFMTGNDFYGYLDSKYGNLYSNCTSEKDAINIGESAWQNENGKVQYYNLNNTKSYNPNTPFNDGGSIWQSKSYKMKNGAVMALYYRNDFGYYTWCIVVDVNGSKKGPNLIGRDTFYFYINDETDSSAKRASDGVPGELYPRFESGTRGYWFVDGHNTNPGNYENSCNPATGTGYACAERIMRDNWKMNY